MIRVCHMTSIHNQCDMCIFEKECISLENAGYATHLIAPREAFYINNNERHGVEKAR